MSILKQKSESLVMVNEDIQKLRHGNIVKGSFALRSKTYETDKGNIKYIEEQDYLIDYEKGSIKRALNSKISNWAEHVLFNVRNFDHEKYDDYSNAKYMLYVDYDYISPEVICCDDEKTHKISKFMRKVQNGNSLKYVVFGDSISAGGEASRDELTFYNRFAEKVRGYNRSSKIIYFRKY